MRPRFNVILRKGNEVHITFNNECYTCIADGISIAPQAVQGGTFVVHRGFRRVDVFGLFVGIERARAKGDGTTCGGVNGEGDAIAKTVVKTASCLSWCDQAGTFEYLRRESPAGGDLQEAIPLIGRVTEGKGINYVAVYAAIFEVCHCIGGFLVLCEQVVKIFDREFIGAVELVKDFLLVRVCWLCIGQGYARAIGELANGFDKADVFYVAEKCKAVAARTAGKTLVDLFFL